MSEIGTTLPKYKIVECMYKDLDNVLNSVTYKGYKLIQVLPVDTNVGGFKLDPTDKLLCIFQIRYLDSISRADDYYF